MLKLKSGVNFPEILIIATILIVATIKISQKSARCHKSAFFINFFCALMFKKTCE
jgi:hypothetical protein